MIAEQPVQIPMLNDRIKLAKGKEWGCRACRLFQYAPCFKKGDREEYQATLDPERFERKNLSYMLDGIGPTEGEVMVVCDAPTKGEDKVGMASSGGANLTIKRNAKSVGMDPDQWYFTHAVKCHDPKDKLNFQQAGPCTRFLAQEVIMRKPKTIIAFGTLAYQLLTGKPGTDITTSLCVPETAIVAGHQCIVYPMMSPGYVTHHDYLLRRYLEHFDRLAAYLRGDDDSGVREDNSNYRIVTDVDEAINVCHKMIVAATEKGRVIDMDIETSGLNPYKKGARLSIISMSCSVNVGYAILMNHDEKPWTDDDRRRFIKKGLRLLCRNPVVKLRWHNGKFDVKWFPDHLGFWPRDQIEDTMLTHYASNENMEHGLKPLANLYTDMGDYDYELDRILSAQTFPDRPRYDLVHWKTIGRYAAQDPVATRKLAVAMKREVAQQDEFVHALAYRAMPAFSATLTRLEHNGVNVDLDFTKKTLIPFLTAESKTSWDAIISNPIVRRFMKDGEAEKRAKMKIPKPIEVKRYFEFSLNSPKQLKTLLFDEAYFGHEPPVVDDEGKPSTDKEAMNDLAVMGSPIAKAILSYRLDEKMVGAFGHPVVARLEDQLAPVLHCNLKAHGTKTGRLSCVEPNLQQIPNKSNGLIKRMFVSRYGADGVFVQIDFSQIELRILAAISNDPHMIEAYRSGKDLHLLTACMLFGMTEAQYHALDKDEQKRRRTIAKRVNFGIAYGIGGPGIQSTLKGEGVAVSEDEARSYLDTFFEKYPRVNRWIERVENGTQSNEYSKSLFGRRRRLEQVRSKYEETVAAAMRQGVNHVIQSTAGDMTMTALCLFDQEVCLRRGDNPELILPTIDRRTFKVNEAWNQVHPILQVHDMIGVDCHKDIAPRVVDRLLKTMQGVVEYAPIIWGDAVIKTLRPLNRVPILAEAEVGPNWRDAVKVKTGADIPKAMFVARAKQAKLDLDPKAKWTEVDDALALGKYAA